MSIQEQVQQILHEEGKRQLAQVERERERQLRNDILFAGAVATMLAIVGALYALAGWVVLNHAGVI